MQLGGSLRETLIVPMLLAVMLLEFPPQPAMIPRTPALLSNATHIALPAA
jgi:hypothetical protein